MRSNLFIQWVAFSLLTAAIIAAAKIYGLTDVVFSDATYTAHGIAVFFVCSAIYSGVLTRKITTYFTRVDDMRREFYTIKQASGEATSFEFFRETFAGDLHVLRFLIFASTLIGLIGTAVGVIHLSQSIPTTTITDGASMSKAMLGMMSGFGTAFYTTLVGSISALWLSVAKTGMERELSHLYRLIITGGK